MCERDFRVKSWGDQGDDGIVCSLNVVVEDEVNGVHMTAILYQMLRRLCRYMK